MDLAVLGVEIATGGYFGSIVLKGLDERAPIGGMEDGGFPEIGAVVDNRET